MAQKQYVTGNKPLISFDYAIRYLLKNKTDEPITATPTNNCKHNFDNIKLS